MVDDDAPDMGGLGYRPISLIYGDFQAQRLEAGNGVAQPRKTVLALAPRACPLQSFSTLSIEHELPGS